MSIQAMSWVFDYSKSEGNARLVLLAIANHFGKKEDSFPSVWLIGKEAKASKATVTRAIRELVELGELEVRSGVGRKSNSYSLPKFLKQRAQFEPTQIAVEGSEESRSGITSMPVVGSNEESYPNTNQDLEPKSEPQITRTCEDCGKPLDRNPDNLMAHCEFAGKHPNRKKVKSWPKRSPFTWKVSHVEEKRKRSTGEERAASVRESAKILTRPDRLSASVRDLLSAGRTDRAVDRAIRAWAKPPDPE